MVWSKTWQNWSQVYSSRRCRRREASNGADVKELGELQGQVDYLHCHKMESVENHSRRNNIRIDDISEEPNKNCDDIEWKSKMALESKLNLPFEVKIERAHIYGTGKGNRRRSNSNASANLTPFGV